MGFLSRFRRDRNAAPSVTAVPTPLAPPPDLPVDWHDWDLVPDERIGFAAAIDASPDFGVDPDPDEADWSVALYDEIRGMCGDPAIEALADWLAKLPGVDAVRHTSREHVEVHGTITAAQLRAAAIARLGETGDPGFFGDTALDEF